MPKFLMASYINFYYMQDGNFLEVLSSFYACFIFCTILILMIFYTWVAWHCYKLTNEGYGRCCGHCG